MTQAAAAIFRRHALFWAGAVVVLAGLVWLFGSILQPFVIGAAVAYLLDPAVTRMTRAGTPRTAAVALILCGFFVVVMALLAVIVPFIWREAKELAEAAPGYIEKIRSILMPHIEQVQDRLGANQKTVNTAITKTIGETVTVGSVLSGLGAGGQAVAGTLASFVITPVAAFFMMKEWPRITAWIDGLIPRQSYATVRELLYKIDRKLAGFVRGQLSVAISLAFLYGLALTVAGLNFGFLIGFITGLLAIIPYVSSPFGLTVGLSIAWFQKGDLSYLGVIAAIFAAGQVIETYFLTPKLLGESVGMHPLWIIFAVMAGGTLAGVTGMILAVPTAATAGVLINYAIGRYKNSALYE